MIEVIVVDNIATYVSINNIHEHLIIIEHHNQREWRHKLMIISLLIILVKIDC